MCDFLKENHCKLLNDICPWVYYCNKDNNWKFKKEGNSCKVKTNANIPKGYYKVCFAKHNNLYVSVNNNILVIPNPFDIIPSYVKIYKLKDGTIRLKQWEEKQ